MQGRAEVLIGGRRYRVVGRITMDFVMVDLEENEDSVGIGDVATIVGKDGSGEITVDGKKRHIYVVDFSSNGRFDDQPTMEKLCAIYLLTARRRGMPVDSVARFHLRNGACVEQINWAGDTSAKGMAESHGILVNYRYSGQDLASNNDSLMLDGRITASRQVVDLLDLPDETLMRTSTT